MFETKLPALENYDDYKLYLNDLIEEASRSAERIPMAKFAQAFGLGRSHLSMVMSGQRLLTLRNIHGIADALHMNQSDHEYWEALVHFGQSKDERDKSYYRQKLVNKKVARNSRSITTAAKVLTAEWYIPAIPRLSSISEPPRPIEMSSAQSSV